MPNWKDRLKRPARRSAAQPEAPTDSTETRQTARPAAAQSETSPTEQSVEKPAPPPAKEESTTTPPAQPATEPAEEPDQPAERSVKKEAPVAKTTEENRKENREENRGGRKGNGKGDRREREPARGRETGKKVVAGANALRARIASIVWLVAVICAAVLAIAALMVALGMNKHNAVVSFITDLADALFPFQSFKTFTGHGAHTKEILTNYGIMAIIYLVVGKVVDRIIRP